MGKFIEHIELSMNREGEFEKQYMCNFDSSNSSYIEKNICGDCMFYDNGCTTSRIEKEYGSYNTPSCDEFVGVKKLKETDE